MNEQRKPTRRRMSNIDKELEIARLRERERLAREREEANEGFATLLTAGLAAAVWAKERTAEAHAKRRRAPGLADPVAAYRAACEELRKRHANPTKMAIATEMGIDRGTLNRYIETYGLPYPPRC